MASITLNGYVLECDCADFQHRIERNSNRGNLSELIDRDWQNSRAALPNIICKHLWSAIIYEKLLDEFPPPKDLDTMPPPEREIREDYLLQRNKLRGDDFSVVSPKSETAPWIL